MIEIAETLRSGVERAARSFRGWPESRALGSRGEGKWIPKEELGHLIDSATNNHARFVWAQFSDPFVWPEYDGDAWVAVHRDRDRPWLELVELWSTLNRHVVAVIASVPGSKLGTTCRIGAAEPRSLEWLMLDYLRHLRHHLRQLESA